LDFIDDQSAAIIGGEEKSVHIGGRHRDIAIKNKRVISGLLLFAQGEVVGHACLDRRQF